MKALVFAGALLVALVAFGAVAEENSPLPNLGEQAMDSMTVAYQTNPDCRTCWDRGNVPDSYASDGDGHAVVQTTIPAYVIVPEFRIYWEGELLETVAGFPNCRDYPRDQQPENCIMGIRHIYTIETTLGSDGTSESRLSSEREQQWCGHRWAETGKPCYWSTADVPFSHGGESCYGGYWHKPCNGCPLVCIKD